MNNKRGQTKIPKNENVLLPFFYKKIEDIDPIAVGDRLREIRVKTGMTSIDFGESLQLSYNGISKLERGVATPGGRTLVLLHEIYGVDIQWLLFGYHTTHMDVLNALSQLSDDIKFDIFVRLYSYFQNSKKDNICFVPYNKDAKGVTHFAKWEESLYRPMEDGEKNDEEVECFKNNSDLINNTQYIAKIKDQLSAFDQDRLHNLTKKKSD